MLQTLQQHFHVTIRKCEQSELNKIFQTYDIFWFRLGFRIDKSVLQSGIRTKVIVAPVTGIDHIDEVQCAALEIQIICLRGEIEFLKNVRATAEHTLLLTLMLLRKGRLAEAGVREKGIWNRDLFRGNEIFEKTVGIVGTGRLGKITALLFQAFGAYVIGYDHRDDFPAEITRVQKLVTLAAQADIVSIHLAYNEGTHHLIDGHFFSAMKPGSIFINTARGGIVEEQALLEALQAGKLRGAALDVIRHEYEEVENNPLVHYARQHNNLILTPHIGGNTYESFAKTERFMADKLINFMTNCI